MKLQTTVAVSKLQASMAVVQTQAMLSESSLEAVANRAVQEFQSSRWEFPRGGVCGCARCVADACAVCV